MKESKIVESLNFLYENKFSKVVSDANTGIALRDDINPLISTKNEILKFTYSDAISISKDKKEYLIQKNVDLDGYPEDYTYASITVIENGKDTIEYKFKRETGEEMAISFNLTSPEKNMKIPTGKEQLSKYNQTMVDIFEEVVVYLKQDVKKRLKNINSKKSEHNTRRP